MTISQRLASFVVHTHLADMPSEVAGITRSALLDTLGVTLAGSTASPARIVASMVERFGCKPVAGVIGTRLRTSAPLAALANGVSAHVLDYDDVGADTQGHVSAVLLPAILAVAEEIGASGKQVIEAYVLGVEVWASLSRAMPMLRLGGWHPTSTLGVIGAAAAAAKLLSLDADRTAMALGIAASEASGLVRNFGAMTKSFHAGNGAGGGVMAALLAGAGFTASHAIMEGDVGFVSMFGGKAADVPRVGRDLGSPFALVSPGLVVKKYPSCFGTHRVLDAALHLVRAYDIKPEEVQVVDVHVDPERHRILCHTSPSTALEGKFSAQFAVAVALTDRRLGLAQDTDDKVREPVIRGLMERVTCRVHADWVEGKDSGDSRPDRVVIRLRNGSAYSHEVLTPLGDPRSPLPGEDLLAKFEECAGLALDAHARDRCARLVSRLESLENVGELMRLLAGSTPRAPHSEGSADGAGGGDNDR